MSSIEIVQPGESLALNPEFSGFAHGFGLFETLRVRAGRLELWEAHWRRLLESARQFKIAHSLDSDEVLDAVRELAKKLPTEATIKLSLLKEGDASKLFIYSRPLSSVPDTCGLLMESPGQINECSSLAGHKTHNYLENMLVLEAAHSADCYDGLRLNTQGEIAEGAISNIFFFRDGRWYTPVLACGLLPGVIRETLLQLLEVEEGRYRPADLISAEAVCLTNSSVGLLSLDWLLHLGEKIQLPGAKHHAYEAAGRLLGEFIDASAIQI